jgi:hypothetical protein
MKYAWSHGNLRIMVSDGTFTTDGVFKHVILLALTFDGSNNLVVVACACVDGEDDNNWVWFLNS